MRFPPPICRLLAVYTLASAALLSGCKGDERAQANANALALPKRVDLTGAGATFPYPLYSRWFSDYAARTNVRINYQPIGSGGGIRQLLSHTVDFGATDVPMSDEELASTPVGDVVHVPTVLGAVAITYNLPGLDTPLRLSGETIAEIFLGHLTRWDDRRLEALNPGVHLPSRDILVVHRSDGSGTSYILSDYLTAVNPAWANGPGRGKDVRWPVGIGGKGNEGVAGQVKQLEGAVGYVEVAYARQNLLPVAHIRNRAGNFAAPESREISSAAASITDSLAPGSDLRVSLVNAPGADAYPVVSFTWMLLAPRSIGPEKTGQLATFLRWALNEGNQTTSALGYVPLPASVASRALAQLNALVVH